MLSAAAVELLVDFGAANGGRLNPFVAGNERVPIVIRINFLFTVNNAPDPTKTEETFFQPGNKSARCIFLAAINLKLGFPD